MTSTLSKQEGTNRQRKDCVPYSEVGKGGHLRMGSEHGDTEYQEAEPAALSGWEKEHESPPHWALRRNEGTVLG